MSGALCKINEFEMLIQQSVWSVPQAAKALGYSEGHVYRWKRRAEIPRKSVMTLLKMQLKALQPDECGSEFRFIDFCLDRPSSDVKGFIRRRISRV